MPDQTDEHWDVQFGPAARRALSRLPHRVVHAIMEFIAGPLATNPHQLSKPLRGEFEGLFSARRGDYRVLFRIDADNHALLIVTVAHRAHAYRPG